MIEMASVVANLTVSHCTTEVEWSKKSGPSNPRCDKPISETAFGL